MNENYYKDSWEIYKAESENFEDDFEYYKNLCKDKNVLELFAGYGRLSNYIKQFSQSIECIELDSNFARFINLPKENIHVCNILEFKTKKKFDRIIAGYNSFCLLNKEKEIKLFFTLLSQWLNLGGTASLSYYDYKQWKKCPTYSFKFKGIEILYKPKYDLSKIKEGYATWIDTYENKKNKLHIEHKYPVKIYRDKRDLEKFLKGTGLSIIDVIKDYKKINLTDSGWIEYVLKKTY